MLHYRQPATEWNEALPLGNGRLGCMVHGRTTTELFQLNEDSVWYGGPQERTPPDALRHLNRLRQLIRDGRHGEAEDLVRLAFFSTPASMRHYEPLGNLYIELNHEAAGVEDYRRELDLQTARHTVSYRYQGVWHRRETVGSFPNGVLATRVTSDQPMRMIFRLNRVSDVEWETNEYLDSIHAEDARIVLHATPGGRHANRLCIVLGVRCTDADAGGRVEAIGSCLVVTSTSCVVALGAHTTFRHADPQGAAQREVDSALDTPWDDLCSRQLDDYQRLFGRMTLHMTPDAAEVPTDERLRTGRDAGLAALYHNYGRYLLIASSRDGGPHSPSLPATLQGIWNPSFAPAWGSKYTININLQMNGWPAAPCNLAECMLPVVALLERMAVRGRETASAMYGCQGWCAHHNTDIWADTAPQDRWMPATLWPLGGAWLVADAMDLLTFCYDRALHKRLAPLLDGCVAFLIDFMVVSADGRHLVTSPSLSPENTFVTADGSSGILCEGSTIDTTIVRMVFDKYLWSQAILGGGGDNKLLSQVRTALGKPGTDGPRLQDLTVNAAGRVQEWGMHDYDEHEPGHRHISHLFGLYPASYIDRTKTPALCDAARRVLERRAAHGGGHTGWSRAWLLNLHARLADGEACGEHMDHLLNTSTLPNLLDSHPPFQIDGNFGACAGVLECLVQSVILTEEGQTENKNAGDDNDGNITGTCTQITLLPACPLSWQSGRLDGVRVRGGWEVSMTWEAGQVTGVVRLANTQDQPLPFVVRFPSGKSYRASDDSSVHEIAPM